MAPVTMWAAFIALVYTQQGEKALTLALDNNFAKSLIQGLS